ncbi:MAG: chemotaxis protein MotC [Rhizobiaceae bacterium]
MRRTRSAASCTAAAVILMAAAPCAFGAPSNFQLQPYQMVRSLQLVQDRIANGDSAAMPMQRKLLEMIDERLKRTGIAEFKEQRNFRALLMYAMSGGNPRTVTELLAKAEISPADKALAKGVMGYINGRPADAIEALKGVDPLAEEPELGAFLALVKGSVLASVSPARALSALDQARLLAPGTLIEEAALRRSLALAVQAGDKARFLRASDQYVRRFLHSPYAGQFADSFVSGVVGLRPAIRLDAIAAVISDMDAEHQRFIYLRLARAAALEGQTDLAVFASKRAEPPAGDTPSDPRAGLYASVASITSTDVGEIIEKLQAIDPQQLSESDRQLRDAALRIAREVTARPPTPEAAKLIAPKIATDEGAPPALNGDTAQKPGMLAANATETLVSQTRQQLQSIDKLLQETSK